MNVTPPAPPLTPPASATPVPLANPAPLAAPKASANPVSPGRKGEESNKARTGRERPRDLPAHPDRPIDISV